MNLSLLASGVALVLLSACSTVPPKPAARAPVPAEFWLDLARGEEVSEADVLTDLAGAGAIFVGEAHSIQRHHDVQLRLLQQLFARGVPLVLCLEQLEARDQPAVDRYNRRELDFDALVREIDWPKKWSNYGDYRPLCEFARAHRIPVRGLNAPADLIRTVSRGGGVARLTPEQRAGLPAEIVADDTVYERLMARDETMAANIVVARRIDTAPDRLRTALVIVGAGHMRFGLGTAERVRRRDPGVVERLMIMTESGQLQLTSEQAAQARDVTISHAELRLIGRPPADYIRVLPRTEPARLPPGHPPVPQ
jgi:uncharacterized iron-regulated protein